MAFLNEQGLQQVKNWIERTFVKKAEGKTLTTNDFTDELKIKLDKIDPDAKPLTIQKNGINLANENGVVNIDVPTALSQLSNDLDLASKEELKEFVANAKHITVDLVKELPGVGESNKIYLVENKTGEDDIYAEYLYINENWEKIGTTATTIDLEPYVKKEDLTKAVNEIQVEAISTEEIDQILTA